MQTVVTVNHLVERATWDFTLSGRLLVVDGVGWVVVKGEHGATGTGAGGPGLKVVSAESPVVEVLDGPDLDLPEHLSAYRSVHRRLLSRPLVVRDGRIQHPGGSMQGRRHSLNSKRADWIAVPYVTSFVEIPWKIQVKELRVAAAD